MLSHEHREADHQLGADHLADQRLVVHPVEDALRVERGVLRAAHVEYVTPRDEHLVEEDGAVELVTRRRERVVLVVAVAHRRLPTHDRDTGLVDRDSAVEDLLRQDARTEERADVDPIGERRARADRLHAVDDDAVLARLHDAQRG